MPEQEADDDFTFPTPPQLHGRTRVRLSPSSSSSSSPPPPSWLQFSYSPIRRSFSAADCAASPWRAPRGGASCSPALSDCGVAFSFHDNEEEVMDSLWEDLNDDEAQPAAGGKHNLLLDVSRRRSVGGPGQTKATETEREVLAASRSSRRRSPGLVVMMRALKKMFVAHKSRSKVHKADNQSTAASASASSSSSSSSSSTNSCKK